MLIFAQHILMQTNVLLLTPPFTQLNTPYPATCYLKGFLKTKNIGNYQADIGIEITNTLFSKSGLQKMFAFTNKEKIKGSQNLERIVFLKDEYINSIEDTITFLQGKNPTLSNLICNRSFLPEASRFANVDYLNDSFGKMGMQDKAKHLATLYLEDISDFIKETVDEHFGFSRYAEKLGRSANTFDELYNELQKEYTFIDELTIENIKQKVEKHSPQLVCLSVPFPGNLYSAFRIGQWIKKYHPVIKVAMGGGFPNTELRNVSDERVFQFVDFITLDDGEMPLEFLIEHINGKRKIEDLKRTFTLVNNSVTYINNNTCSDYKQHELGTPDYGNLLLDKYISAIEIVNPMHKLWSDGRWNKLTMAHGCYWGKCTFCDISLPYIKDYEPLTASLLCDRIEQQIKQTGNTGFHFVDEAAPPALMRSLAIEIIKRKLIITWWTNIRFEKNFTQDLCYLLAASGCIAVSGGLEVASDRLLKLIDKGITLQQVAQVTSHFTKAGVMVHAYLMYGYPTQTNQETVDSLEMVRQLFEAGTIQSAFWHRFAMTSHSPVGLQPEKYKVVSKKADVISFADNDVDFDDITGGNHDDFEFGLKKSLLNFMHQIHFDKPLQYWFENKIPKTTVAANYIINCINEKQYASIKSSAKILWLGNIPTKEIFVQSKKGMQREMLSLKFETKKNTHTITLPKAEGEWFLAILQKLHIANTAQFTYQQLKENYEAVGLEDFELFWENKPINKLNEIGLLAV